MKNLLLTAFAVFASVCFVQAQGLNGQISVGAPVGDASDLSSFAINADINYLFDVSDDFQAGPAAGVSHSFGKDYDIGSITIEGSDVTFLTLGGQGRFNASDDFWIQGGIGYALGLNEGNDGGFFWSPAVAYGISEAIDVVLAYRSVSADGGSWDILSLGVEFGLD